MAVIRWVTALFGLVGATYGTVLLVDLGGPNLVATAEWVVGGIILHDAVLAPVTLLLGALLARLARGLIPSALVVSGVVLGTVTIAAIPVLGRFGARADNPTLLDRPYLAGWAVFALLTVSLASITHLRLQRRLASGSRPRRGFRR